MTPAFPLQTLFRRARHRLPGSGVCAGLVAQQQCVGPFQLPLADVAVTAQAHQGSLAGLATSLGEQPLKGLIDPAAMARLALAEALTNLVFAPVTALQDVRASVNWMHAAKVRPGPWSCTHPLLSPTPRRAPAAEALACIVILGDRDRSVGTDLTFDVTL